MANILATVTEDARKYWPQFFGTLLGLPISDPPVPAAGHWNPLIKFFRVGEGGWVTDNTTPRTPQANLRRIDSVSGYGATPVYLQDLDCVIDTQRDLADQRYPNSTPPPAYTWGWFEKALNPLTDFTFTAPSTISIRCLLDFGDFNDTYAQVSPTITAPNICELALYSDHPLIAPEHSATAAYNMSNHTDYVNYTTGAFLPDSRFLVAYGTFPVEVKDSSKQIEHLVQIIF